MNVLVYTPHSHDFLDEPDNFYIYKFKDFREDFEGYCKRLKELCKKGVVDCGLIDEFDLIFRHNFDVKQASADVFTSHRHYNISLIGITRRPQDIPTYFFESCKNIISFSIQGENAKRKFDQLYKGMGDLITRELNYEMNSPNNFVIKEIGKEPFINPHI